MHELAPAYDLANEAFEGIERDIQRGIEGRGDPKVIGGAGIGGKRPVHIIDGFGDMM